MLKIAVKPVFTVPVKVNTAAIKGEFMASFEALPSDALEALDTGEAKAWREVLARVVVGFDLVEVGGEQVAFTDPQGLQNLIRWPGVGQAMLAAYYAGLWSEAQGN